VAESKAMSDVLALAEVASGTDLTVLIEGETGVGKERVARAIHAGSHRAGAAFVAVNCGALQESLLESELFGVKRGAFTGAHCDRPGLFEAAHGGTLFLDEVGELGPAGQVALLRALQEGEIRRVGDTRSRRVDVRVVAATNRDLAAEVEAGRFREDLYYRLTVFPIRVPALRERPEDVMALAERFAERSSARQGRAVVGIEPEALEKLAACDWPGNVRQLENELERAVALAPEGGSIGLACLSQRVSSARSRPTRVLSASGSLKERVRAFERDCIEAALQESRGNGASAARALGVTRQLLHRRIHDLGLERGRFAVSAAC
jgi:transcriptional regulator with GAF, ATPase, and Fis domain